MKRAALLVFGLLGTLIMLAAACGGEDAAPTFTRAPATATTVPPATSQPTPTIAPTKPQAPTQTVETPAGGPSLEISVVDNDLAFDTSDFEVAAGADVNLVFDNVSTINQHNWVLVTPGTKDDVAARGITQPTTNWLQPGDPDVIANTILLDPETSGEVRFTAPAAGTYQFVCTFPGHNLAMFGDFVVTP